MESGSNQWEDEDERSSQKEVANIPYARRRWWQVAAASVLVFTAALGSTASTGSMYRGPWSDPAFVAALNRARRVTELADEFAADASRLRRVVSGVGVQELAEEIDAWGRPLTVFATRAEVAIVSRGPDGFLGTKDDENCRLGTRPRSRLSGRSRNR